jgi:hypothetical protein
VRSAIWKEAMTDAAADTEEQTMLVRLVADLKEKETLSLVAHPEW